MPPQVKFLFIDDITSEFFKRMQSAPDKKDFCDLILSCKPSNVLDLGAGGGDMSQYISSNNVFVMSVDIKDNHLNENRYLKQYVGSIEDFLDEPLELSCINGKYDVIILSAVLHELNPEELDSIRYKLPRLMSKDCKIFIREPFGRYNHLGCIKIHDNIEELRYILKKLTSSNDYPDNLIWTDSTGPIPGFLEDEFIRLVKPHIPLDKLIEWQSASKKSEGTSTPPLTQIPLSKWTAEDWLNLVFALVYDKDSWDREKHEYRFCRNLNWAREFFNFPNYHYEGFTYKTLKDMSYKKHFERAGFPSEVFDMIDYTTCWLIFNYKV